MERLVKFTCTGHGKGGHTPRTVARVAIRDGVAVEVGRDLFNALRRREGPGPDFALVCNRCQRQPRASRERMTVLVTMWLDENPTRTVVVRDISDPATAKLF